MLREIDPGRLAQREPGLRTRWLVADGCDLFVWESPSGRLEGFRYSRGAEVLEWSPERGLRTGRVDDGERDRAGPRKLAPLVTYDSGESTDRGQRLGQDLVARLSDVDSRLRGQLLGLLERGLGLDSPSAAAFARRAGNRDPEPVNGMLRELDPGRLAQREPGLRTRWLVADGCDLFVWESPGGRLEGFRYSRGVEVLEWSPERGLRTGVVDDGERDRPGPRKAAPLITHDSTESNDRDRRLGQDLLTRLSEVEPRLRTLLLGLLERGLGLEPPPANTR